MIRFENVKKSFGSKQVLNGISFTVNTGEIFFILGKSGTGKSVTLKNLVGLLKPDSGKITIQDPSSSQTYEIETLEGDTLFKVRRLCGMVFQNPALLDSLNIFENVAFGLKDWSEGEKKKRVLECLKLVHLDEGILSHYPPEISFGMQKRVSIARTIAPSPKYLLFDEPTTGLDPITTNAINDLILELSRKLNVTSLVVSHDMGCALKIADRIMVLDQGGILEIATPTNLKKSIHTLIQDFLSETL